MLNTLQCPVREEDIRFFRENGFVCLRKIISDEAVQLLRASLEEAFSRDDPRGYGARTDMTAAAKALADEGKTVLVDRNCQSPQFKQPCQENTLLKSSVEDGTKGVRKFEHEGYVAFASALYQKI